jgi:hypothetical protein
MAWNEKIARLAKALQDDLILRLGSAANSFPVAVAYDGNKDLYLTVTDAPGSSAIVKFETQAAAFSGQTDSLGLTQAVYTPHIVKLGIDAGATGALASDTATLSGVVATDTLVINGVTLTATVATQDTDEFIVGGTDIITATNLVTTITANPTLAAIVTASNVGGTSATVTITAVSPGVAGNSITVTEGGGNITIATPTLTGGTNSTAAGTSDNLRNTLIAEVAPTATALIIYENAGIVVGDLIDDTLRVTTIRNIPWGILAQI